MEQRLSRHSRTTLHGRRHDNPEVERRRARTRENGQCVQVCAKTTGTRMPRLRSCQPCSANTTTKRQERLTAAIQPSHEHYFTRLAQDAYCFLLTGTRPPLQTRELRARACIAWFVPAHQAETLKLPPWVRVSQHMWSQQFEGLAPGEESMPETLGSAIPSLRREGLQAIALLSF